MGMGRRKAERQRELWVASSSLPVTPHHVFYEKLNTLLTDSRFDEFVEKLCRPHYADNAGRESIPPGAYFRMLFVGYFEGIDSQRGIAWRCADSRSISRFWGYAENEETPDHSSLTRIRNRLPEKIHLEVFQFVLKMAEDRKLLKGKMIAVDSTTLEANAAMKSIVRRDTGEDWRQYIRRLAQEQGAPSETEEDLRRFDKNRPDKKVSNEEWVSETDSESRIAKMKDGRTHLAYKAEHVMDLETELLLSAEVYHADTADTQTLVASVTAAQENLDEADAAGDIQEVVADKGYHAADTLAQCSEWNGWGLRTYILEPKRRQALGLGVSSVGRNGRSVREPAARAGRAQQASAASAQRAGGTELRSHVRHGRTETHLAQRPDEDSEALLDPRCGAESGSADAKALRIQKASDTPARGRAFLSCATCRVECGDDPLRAPTPRPAPASRNLRTQAGRRGHLTSTTTDANFNSLLVDSGRGPENLPYSLTLP
jgi:transposase